MLGVENFEHIDINDKNCIIGNCNINYYCNDVKTLYNGKLIDLSYNHNTRAWAIVSINTEWTDKVNFIVLTHEIMMEIRRNSKLIKQDAQNKHFVITYFSYGKSRPKYLTSYVNTF